MSRTTAEAQHTGLVWNNEGKTASAPAFAQFSDVVQGCTSRRFNQDLPSTCSTIEEIRAACKIMGLDNVPIVLGQQQHTSNVAAVTPADLNDAMHFVYSATDALVTDATGLALVIQTADCAPVFLYDPKARVVGLVHAGWRGTLARIAENAVARMVALGADPADMIAWIGPTAGPCCYEVNEEMIESFSSEFSHMPREAVHDGRLLNLLQINSYQLKHTGIPECNISTSEACTIHGHEHFYSYRADNGTTGRILSVLAMVEK